MADDQARDKAIENLVSGKLRGRKSAKTAACADAEILSAYVERSLAPREREQWETHFAGCAYCQETIAQLVKLDEEEEAELLPAPAQRKRSFALRWAWAAPMLLVMLMAGLWYTGEFNSRLKQTSETSAPVRSASPAVVNAPKPTEDQNLKKEDMAATRQESQPAAKKARADETHNEQARGEAGKAAGGRLTARTQEAAQAPPMPEASAPAANPTAGNAPQPAGAPVMASAPPVESKPEAMGAIAAPSERARLQADITDQVSQSKLDATSAGADVASKGKSSSIESRIATDDQSRGEIGAKSANNRGALLKSKTLAGTSDNSEFHYTKSPSRIGPGFFTVISPQYLWRVGRYGLIQKQGLENKWETKPSGVETDLLAAAFFNGDIGWVVGKSGTILHTTDGGNTWSKIPSPTNEDIVGVKATGTESAEIRTRSGLAFQTSDGGRTWAKSSQ